MTLIDQPPAFGTRVSVDDLPKYSAWPQRLLQATGSALHPKDRGNVLREFNDEKWASLLARLQQLHRPGLAQLEELISPSGEERVYINGGELFRAPAHLIQQAYLTCLTRALQPIGPVECIAELGGGAGNLLLHLAQSTNLAGRWISYELTENGRRVTDTIANADSLPVTACLLDFDSPIPASAAAAPGCLYYSSFALAYCRDPYPFLRSLLDADPIAIVLVEPICQFFDKSTLLGLMASRYFEFNAYSAGLLPAIERLVAEGRVSVAGIERNFFGHNPLCPVSALHVAPARRS